MSGRCEAIALTLLLLSLSAPAWAGTESLTSSAPSEGLEALEAAARAAQSSPIAARDLAVAYARAGRVDEALAEVDRAMALGDVDPEVHAFRAVLLARAGRRGEALAEAQAADGFEGELIGSALLDPVLAERARLNLDDTSPRAALTALVLSAYAGARGLHTIARSLALEAEDRATDLDVSDVAHAARALERRIDAKDGLETHLLLRTAIDHATNPLYAYGQEKRSALRLGLTGAGFVGLPVGRVRIDASARIDQRFMLMDREDFHELDTTAFGLQLAIELPIGLAPGAARAGLVARATDLFGDRLDLHYATAVEGGPYLVVPLGASFALEGGVFGVAADFIDRSPPDARISSQNRDRVGQRATLALSYASRLLDARIETAFLNDDALGDAFDAVGGLVAGRVEARPGDGVLLRMGFAITGRDFGPVGDRAIIGPAAVRTEVRTAVELGVRVPLSNVLGWSIEDIWARNNARRGHGYTENVLSLGLEAMW